MVTLSYLIIVHNEIEHLKKLIKTLDSQNTFFFIHIDAKLTFDNKNFLNSLEKKENVHFLEPRIKANWGGFSLVDITLKLLILCNEKVKCDYINLISGQDFPIKSNRFIQNFLKENYPSQFIEFYELPTNRWKGYFNNTRFERYWHIDEFGFEKSRVLVDNQFKNRIIKETIDGVKLYGGSQWFTITQECAQFILNYVEETPKFYKYFKSSLASDEVFFNTIIMNSPFCNNVTNNNKRVIKWSDEYPKVFKKIDFLELTLSDCLWARKFDSKKDTEIVLLLQNFITKENLS